jgi:hypothetical protein
MTYRMHFIAHLGSFLAIAALSACSSFTTYKTARPLSKGATQTLVAPQLDSAGPKDTGKAPFPEIAVSVRHGITERIEVGGTLTVLPLGEAMQTLGFEGLGKLHLHQTRGGRVDLAVGAGAGYRVYSSSGAVFEMVHASVPLIVGINLRRSDQLVIAPAVAWQRWYSTGARPVDVPSLGVSLGYRWQISQRFALMPEMTLASSPTALAGFGDTAMAHVGIALVFGRD